MLLTLMLVVFNTLGMLYLESFLHTLAPLELVIIFLFVVWSAIIVIAELFYKPWSWNLSVAYFTLSIANLTLLFFATINIWVFIFLMIVNIIGLVRAANMISFVPREQKTLYDYRSAPEHTISPGYLTTQYRPSTSSNQYGQRSYGSIETYETTEKASSSPDIFSGTPFADSNIEVVPYSDEEPVRVDALEPWQPSWTKKKPKRRRIARRAVSG